MSRLTRRRRILAIDADHPGGWQRVDTLSVEEPLEIRIGGQPYTVTMRTPGYDVELAHGLLSADGVISCAQDIRAARYCAGATQPYHSDETDALTSGLACDTLTSNTYNVLDITLASGGSVASRRTHLTMTSACGVCGTQSIAALRTALPWDLTDDTLSVSAETILAMPERLRQAQSVFHTTGGLHGVALFDTDGQLLVAREDVGRHNATDKVVGWAMCHGRRPARGTILCVSGRTSFEIIHKAAMAGIAVVAGISAPSSLAVEMADELGITLIGFVRAPRMNIYTHPQRVRPLG